MSVTLDIAAIASGRGPAATHAMSRFAEANREDRRSFLDQLLPACEAGPCLDLLLAILREHRVLHPPIRRYLMSDDDIDAAEQQALVSIAYSVQSFAGTGSSLSWMNQIAANEAKMLIRSRERHASRAAGTVDDHLGDFVHRLSTFVADEVTINNCLAQLRNEWRQALVLREEGLSYDDVAARLDVPVGTAKTWVARARRALADLLIEHSITG